jgi:hypothetical protein
MTTMTTMNSASVDLQLQSQGFTSYQINTIFNECTQYISPGKPDEINADDLKMELNCLDRISDWRKLSSSVTSLVTLNC